MKQISSRQRFYNIWIISQFSVDNCFSMIGSAEDVIEEHASVQQVKLAHQQPILGTLDECFRLYTQEEQVTMNFDEWKIGKSQKCAGLESLVVGRSQVKESDERFEEQMVFVVVIFFFFFFFFAVGGR